LNYVKYLEKPPLAYWLVSVSYGLFGVSAAAARLVPAVCALGVVALVFMLGRSMHGPRAGFYAGLTLATSALFFGLSRILLTDMVLCLGVVLALYGAWISREGARWGPYLFWLGCAAGFLTKGLLGPGLPIMAVVLFVLAGGEWGLLRALAAWRPVALFVGLSAPWVVLAGWHNPGFLSYFFVHEQFGRLLTDHHNRYEPPWYYLALLPGACFPWIALLPWAAVRSWPGRAWRSPERRAWLFAAVWFLSFLAFFSASSSKMMHYILPALPPLALILGRELERVGEAGWRQWAPPGLRAGVTAAALLCLVLGGGLAAVPALAPDISYQQAGAALLVGPVVGGALAAAVFGWRRRLWASLATPLALFGLMVLSALAVAPRLEAWRSVAGLTEAAAQELRPGDLWVNYGDYYHGSVFYSRRRVAVVQNWGELDYGRRRAPDAETWFIPDDAAFIRRMQSPRLRVIGIAETEAFQRLRAKTRGVPGVLLFEWERIGDKSLFSNRPR
jgi:4-amino-4-deoxy-L-arabinose transferase-like glycosyltransferase